MEDRKNLKSAKVDWKTVKLGVVGRIVGGATPSTKNPRYYDGDIPWITPKDLSNYNFVRIRNGERFITEEGMESCSVQMLPKGSILFSSRAPIGYVAIADCELCTNQGFKSIVPGDSLDSLFGYYLLRFNKDKIESLGSGTTFKEVSGSTMRDVEVTLPPLPIQRKIAAVLGAIDDKIENNRKICANLEAQAQALFKSWFVDGSGNIARSEQIQDVFDVTIGRTPPRKEFEWFSESRDDNVVWVSIADMGSCGVFVSDSSEYLTKEAIKNFKYRLVPKGAVLLSFKLTVGRVAIADVDLVTNEAIAQLRTSKGLMREYLYCYLKQFDYDKLGSTSSIATAVNSTTIREMPFPVPKEKVLEEFHRIVSPLFESIRVVQTESRALAELRDALLPKLMSGEIDVDEVEI